MSFFRNFGSKKRSKSSLALTDGDAGWGGGGDGGGGLQHSTSSYNVESQERRINKLERINNDLEDKNEQLEEENNMLKLKVGLQINKAQQLSTCKAIFEKYP